MSYPIRLAPGDFFVTRTPGWQARAIRIGTDSPVNHAGIYLGRGVLLEARPGGAGYAPLSAYPNARWSTNVADLALTDAQQAQVPRVAQLFLGVPYNWLDIGAISLECFGIKTTALNHRIERTDRLICSQLVDRFRAALGSVLFNDGRLSCMVTPGDLLNLIESF